MVDSLTRQSDAGHYGVRAPQMSDAGTYHGDPVVGYVRAPQLVQTMIEAGASKQNLPAGHIFVRGMFGGALLAYATGIAFFAAAGIVSAALLTARPAPAAPSGSGGAPPVAVGPGGPGT